MVARYTHGGMYPSPGGGGGGYGGEYIRPPAKSVFPVDRRPYPGDYPAKSVSPVDRRPYPGDYPAKSPFPVDRRPYPGDYPAKSPFPVDRRPYPGDYPAKSPFPVDRRPYPGDYPAKSVSPVDPGYNRRIRPYPDEPFPDDDGYGGGGRQGRPDTIRQTTDFRPGDRGYKPPAAAAAAAAGNYGPQRHAVLYGGRYSRR